MMSTMLAGQYNNMINYQGLLLGADGSGMANRTVTFTVIISEDFAGNNRYYAEQHEITTTVNGVFNLDIGGGDPLEGTMDDIDWLADIPYIKMNYDLMQGNGLQSIGPQSFEVVPFCFSSKYVMCQDGRQGDSGNAGPQGEQGLKGDPGEQGKDGDQGQAGDDGRPVMEQLSAPPTGADEGTVYLDSGANRTDGARGFRYYDGGAWIDL